jgi:hypothetical protein
MRNTITISLKYGLPPLLDFSAIHIRILDSTTKNNRAANADYWKVFIIIHTMPMMSLLSILILLNQS